MQEWGKVRILMYLLSLMIQFFKAILMTPMSLLFPNCLLDLRPTTSLEVSNDEPKNYMHLEVALTFLLLRLLCFLNTTIEISVVIVLILWSSYYTPLPLIPLIS